MFYVFCTVNFNWGCGCLHHNLCRSTMADSEAKVSSPSSASSDGQEADKLLLIEKTDQILTGAGERI